jgi:hypothetical protein
MPTIIAWEDASGAEQVAVFDTDMQEVHERANVIPEHPVEVGQDVADDVRRELRRFAVEGCVSDTPLVSSPGAVEQGGEFREVELQIAPIPLKFGVSQLAGAAIDAIGDAILGTGAPKVHMFRFDDLPSRKRAAFELLEGIWEDAQVVRIITSMSEYDNMILESLTATRTPDDGDGAKFSIAFKEILRVKSELVLAPEPAEVLGQPKVSAGSKHVEDDQERAAEVKKTILAKIVDSGASLFDF